LQDIPPPKDELKESTKSTKHIDLATSVKKDKREAPTEIEHDERMSIPRKIKNAEKQRRKEEVRNLNILIDNQAK
jgi:hypothetical protein